MTSFERKVREKFGDDFMFDRPTRESITKINGILRVEEKGSNSLANRAIRSLYNSYRRHIEFTYNIEYVLALEQELSRIVNTF